MRFCSRQTEAPNYSTLHDGELKHLNLLVVDFRSAYASTTSRPASLLKNGEVTYNLLWALFKPNVNIYKTILDAEEPACYRYDSGEQKKPHSGVPYFHVDCHYLDFNGQEFSEVSTARGISP